MKSQAKPKPKAKATQAKGKAKAKAKAKNKFKKGGKVVKPKAIAKKAPKQKVVEKPVEQETRRGRKVLTMMRSWMFNPQSWNDQLLDQWFPKPRLFPCHHRRKPPGRGNLQLAPLQLEVLVGNLREPLRDPQQRRLLRLPRPRLRQWLEMMPRLSRTRMHLWSGKRLKELIHYGHLF